jgi:hypothetical protein
MTAAKRSERKGVGGVKSAILAHHSNPVVEAPRAGLLSSQVTWKSLLWPIQCPHPSMVFNIGVSSVEAKMGKSCPSGEPNFLAAIQAFFFCVDSSSSSILFGLEQTFAFTS